MVIGLTLLFRVFELGIPQGILRGHWENIREEKETGQEVRSLSVFFPFIAESVGPLVPPTIPSFSPEDGAEIAIVNTSRETPDCGALIAQPLYWSLTTGGPRVLILHTHTTESYTQTDEAYTESADYRTLAEDYNMLSIGDRVAELLEDAGITVIHDRTLHDYPSYTSAYTHARKSIRQYLTEYPGIQLVLDLHRDAMEDSGGQIHTAVGDSAQIMFVMGTGSTGLPHPNWRENLSVALKLSALLEENRPGILRPMSLRPQRYNQDLSNGALLVEIGTAGNTHAEALQAAQALAEAVIALERGSE